MDFLTAFKDYGFPAVMSLGLLYMVGVRLGEIEKKITDKLDDVVANQIMIIKTMSEIRGSQVDDIARESGRTK